MELVERYCFNIAVRFIAIRKIRKQSGKVAGTDNITLQSDSECLDLLNLSSWKNRKKWPQCEVKVIIIPKAIGGKSTAFKAQMKSKKPSHYDETNQTKGSRQLGIGSILDRVLQSAFHSLMDPYYEAQFPADMYGFRKGRNATQAIGLLKHITEQSRNNDLGILLLDINKCYDSINHNYILNVFDHPDSLTFLLIRWLKPWIRLQNGNFIERKASGVTQGSIIGPLICNVVLMRLLHGEKINNKRPKTFDSLKQTKTINGKQRNIYRHLIYYADDLAITTNNPDELKMLLDKIQKDLDPASLKLNPEKSSLIDLGHSSFKKIEFDYLGFHFLYVPTKKLRKGGIITRNDDITTRKNSANHGTFLVYVSNKNLAKIKEKCAKIIKKVTRISVLEALNLINPVLRGHAQYFAWSNSYNRLKTLEGLIYKAFKKYILRKFKNEGKNSPVWIAHTFFVSGKKPSQPKSPYNLAWHLHAELPKTQSNIKRLKTHLFQILPTKAYKILTIKSAALTKSLRGIPYYYQPSAYTDYQVKLMAKRRFNLSFKDSLFIRQEGICPVCTMPLTDISSQTEVDQEPLEIHHILKIGGDKYKSEKERKKLDSLNNLQLLHKNCHAIVSQEA